MTSSNTTPMTRVATALARTWAESQAAGRRIAELQRWQVQSPRRTR